MAFPRRLLVDNEELVLELRPHPVALVPPILWTLLVVIGWALILPHIPGSGGVHDLLQWATWLVGFGLILWFAVRKVVAWITSYFVLTSDRIIHRQGLIAKYSMEIPLEAINDVRFVQRILERMVGAGSLIVQSASEHGRQVFKDIRKPEDVQKAIYHQGELNQKRMMTVQATSPAPEASVADELKKLDELRDSGVISPEEFEAQKKKLLG